MGNVGCPKVKKGFIWRNGYVCFFWKPLIAITDRPCYDLTVVRNNFIFDLVLLEFEKAFLGDHFICDHFYLWPLSFVINLDHDPLWLNFRIEQTEQFEERLEECLLAWNWITKRNNKIFVIS